MSKMLKKKFTHGGSRPPVRKDDGRLTYKIKDPVREVIPLECKCRDEMVLRYGREWRGVVRKLIKEHLEDKND